MQTMTSRPLLIVALALTPLVACTAAPQDRSATTAAPSPHADLHEEIAAADAGLFDAYNTQDIDRVRQYFAEDLEFYHDQGGLQSHADVMKGLADVFARHQGHRRELVADSLRVHPIAGYGAIQTGAHRFCHEERGREDCGVFQFAHVWKRTDEGWRITRALSYGH